MSESESPKKRVLVLLIDKNEDVEVSISTYVFRVAGLETILAGVEGKEPVTCVQGLVIQPDMSLEEARKTGPFDVIFLPGGVVGSENFAQSSAVGDVLKEQEEAGRVVAAICCAPAFALTKFPIYKGKKLTCYPKDYVRTVVFDRSTHTHVDEPIVEDGQLLTAQGPALCFDLALAVLKKICGPEKAKETSDFLLMDKIRGLKI